MSNQYIRQTKIISKQKKILFLNIYIEMRFVTSCLLKKIFNKSEYEKFSMLSLIGQKKISRNLFSTIKPVTGSLINDACVLKWNELCVFNGTVYIYT